MNYWTELEWERFLGDAVASVFIIGGGLLFWLVVCRALRALESKSRVSQALLLPVKLVARYLVILIVVLLCLTSYGIPIGSFWTLVSAVLGLVAIGFVAVWSVLSNISATFLILLAKPFKIGDYVALVGDEVMGRVIDINFLFTTLRMKSGDTYRVPNNQFFQKCLLRPVDAERFEAKRGGEEQSEAPDHSQANLEGIKTK
jgi:small-conductance mechanosensitive channel